MNANQATALATRLAEELNAEGFLVPFGNSTLPEVIAAMELILQAQAVEDVRHEKMLRFQRTESVQEVERLQIVEEHLRALVGRMKGAITDLRDAKGRYNSGLAYVSLMEALADAEKITA